MDKHVTIDVFEIDRGTSARMLVASVTGPREQAKAQAEHYAMVYGQDGPVEVRERKR